MEANLDHILPPLRVLAIPIAKLHPDPANARKHGDRNLETIKASLAKFGQRAPIVVQKQGMIVRAGNGRLLAAKELGWEYIAAVVVDEADVEATAFAIADNRTAELATWDKEALASLLDGLDKDIRDMTGFSDDDYQLLMSELEPDFKPGSSDDQSTLDDKDPVTCPQCGHEFQPKA